ncbi:MAG TPA: hypothetical protein EYG17_03365 [Acidimicrobiia bacterium]|jgi:hypothetical protein|nr:hypothetical protein [Acidimicrobiia bacterium]HIL05075.1 hypothetical protein [Acidimicrobiia bacterium]
MPIKIAERQLRRNSEQIASVRAELVLLDEQWAFLSDEADTARLYALVSETPISERNHQRAARHVEVIDQQRSQVADRLGQLEGRQDALLDQISERSR